MASTLTEFLAPVAGITKKVALKRFPEPFTIKAISQEEHNQIISKTKNKNGVSVNQYTAEIVLAGTVDPDFSDSQLCAKCGTLDPLEVVGKVLLAGEGVTLQNEILSLSGFDAEEAAEEAKN